MLFEALSRHASSRPGDIAIVCHETRLSWSQWHEQALLRSATLPAEGVAPIHVPNSPEFLITLLACAHRGVSALLLPSDSTADERARLLAAAQPGCFLLLPTSGTTGQPKLVPRTQAQLATLGMAFLQVAQVTSQDRIFCAVPLAHGYGLCAGLLATLFSGATLHIQERFDRRQLLRSLANSGITILAAAPFHYNVLAATHMPEAFAAPHLRLALSGGAPLPSELWFRSRNRLGFHIRQTYGTSETGMISANMLGDPESFHASVGHPLPGFAVAVHDPRGAALPPGAEGVIAVRDTRSPDSCWTATNDLGRLDDTGRLHVSGRRQDLLSIGGRKFHPAEVQAVLRSHSLVSDVTIESFRSPSGEDACKAIVVCHAPCTPEEIIDFCRQRLAPHKVPGLVEIRFGRCT